MHHAHSLEKTFPLRAAPPGRGVLSASTPDGRLDRSRVLPAPDLASFIHHYGSVHWDLRTPFEADTLQHPAARIEVEAQGDQSHAQAVGVRTGRFGKALVGRGRFFIVQFRPATLQPLLSAPLAALTDSGVPLATLFGADAERWTRALDGAHSVEDEIAVTETFLRARLPALPTAVAAMRDLVERIAQDPTLCRVEQVASAAGLDVRTLQRHFRNYVGVSPKWVIQRYRLLEAAQQLRSAPHSSLAGMAAQLGYADQAHFVREFRAFVGRTPGAFVRDEAVTAEADDPAASE